MHSQAKILGTVVTVGGAMILTMIKGPVIEMFSTGRIDHHVAASSDHSELVKGALLISIGLFCWASFVILQVSLIDFK